MSITIYHNNRCSKSRAALQLLRDQGIEPDIVEYMKQPLERERLLALIDRLDLQQLRDMMRTKEPAYRESGLEDADREQLIQAMLDNPKLIERPIVVGERGAVIARPAERLLDLLAGEER